MKKGDAWKLMALDNLVVHHTFKVKPNHKEGEVLLYYLPASATKSTPMIGV